ncbi:PAS domain S-box protein, partial [Candidatus Bipolaricaulota bacterium]
MSKLRILLIEDNPGDERLFREYLGALEQALLRIDTVATLKQALVALQDKAFDLILADLGLPDSQGLNTATSLLASSGETPVVVLTGADDRELAEKAIHAGAQDYLPKSAITPELLSRTITHAIERQRTRDAIRQSEQRFRAIFEASPLAIAMVRANERGFITANRAFSKLLGYEIDEILSLSMAEVTHPDDVAEDQRGIQAILDGSQETFAREKRLVQKDGRTIWVSAVGTVLRDATGAPQQVLLVQQDVTVEKEATSALEAERERLRSVMETMPAFLYLQATDHTIPYANSRFRENFGDPEGRTCHQIFRGNNAPCEPCETLAVLESRNEMVREWTDDRERVFEIRERPFAGPNGKELVLVIGTEITDLIQATKAMRVSEQRFRELAQMLPEVVFECDLEGSLTFANQVAFDRFGYSQEEFDAGLEVFNMMITADRGRARASVARLLRGGEERGSQYTAIRSDGTTFPAIIHSSVIWQDDKPVGLRGILVDISEQQRAQQDLLLKNSVFEASLAAHAISDVNADLTHANAAFVHLWGYRDENEVLGRNISSFFDDPGKLEIVSESLRSDGKWEGEFVGKRKDESTFVVHALATEIRDDSGDIVAFEATFLDMTESMEAQEAVRSSEARHRLLFESAPVGIGYFTTEGDIIALNRTAAKRLGGEPDDYVGINVADYSENPSEALRRFSEAAESNDISTYQDKVESPAGLKYVLRSYNSLRDSTDAVVGIQVISSDITEQMESQRALAESEARHRLLFESSPIGIGYHSLSGETLAINATAVSRLKGKRDDYLGRGIAEYYRDPEEVRQRFALAIDSPEGRTYEDRVERDGDVAWYQRTYTAMRDTSGEPVGVQIISTDITAIKNVQEALEMGEHIIRLSPVGMFIYLYEGSDDLILADANPEAEKLTGIQLSEMRGREFNEIWPEARAIGLTDACLTAFRNNTTYSTAELSYKDQRISGHFRVRAFRIPGDRLVVSFEDISELREAEEALRHQEIQYRSLFENAALGIYQTTPDGRILAANPALVQLLGYSSFEELATRNLEEEGYEPVTSRADFKRRLEQDGSFVGGESSWTRKDGTPIHIRENARIVRADDGKVLYYEGTLEDITERKESEAAVRESEHRYRSIVELSPVGIVTVDLRGRISSCNQSFLSMTGYQEDDLVGKHFTKLPPAHARDLPKY